MAEAAVTWRIATPASAAGAIAIIELVGPAAELARTATRLGLASPAVGTLLLADLCGVDRGMVAVWSPTCLHLMPHGGIVVVRELAAALTAAGVPEATDPALDLRARFPEASDDDEALMLAALAHARSPRAVDLILDQPRRWRAWRSRGGPGPLDNHSAVLDRLIHPPLVAAVGSSNIGKSSLTNALAKEAVSIVADEPGTTRDHVGVELNLDGLVVRFVDTPGIRHGAPPEESKAAAMAWKVVSSADLVLLCGEGTSPPVAPAWLDGHPATLRVALRADLGPPEGWRADVSTSAVRGEGLSELAGMVRRRLVPDGALEDPRPWRPNLRVPVRGE